MKEMEGIYSPSLEGVYVGETKISNVEGDIGRLSYRGLDIETLSEMSYLDVVVIILFGHHVCNKVKDKVNTFLLENQKINDKDITYLKSLPKTLHPMLMLQSAVPLLSKPKGDFSFLNGDDPDLILGLYIAAKLPALVAGWYRIQNGMEPLKDVCETGINERFLKSFTGKSPSKEQIKALDLIQILQLEHSFNAGTFTGRVCASAHAPLQSVISASIGTLFGKLHGGADQAALEMAFEIGSKDKAADYLSKTIAAGEKIMGMGHREYRTVDPRAKILKPFAKEFCTEGEGKRLFEILLELEDLCQAHFSKKGKNIWANLEFYKGPVLYSLGIPGQYFTSVFAMSRVFGYLAHYLEFKENRRIIRPRARYTGVLDVRKK
ncbi:citrate/2-methylcitrate synthase [Pseudoalteromonas sp. S16_S37]|uniref:citrate/2-methylcitrate synthase n=1 Tax=Pseudoalteromonas sp. S16_S37 TaxID=2720228 RepID=UPI0016811DAC|nr:citrate/2-methylcitrate synthase [Pseudoalteromonas sp. S16_S37]MBD1583633.1 citrate/2-methylcitrate synthase [Pseudoalteromonas sp. S16_S37]